MLQAVYGFPPSRERRKLRNQQVKLFLFKEAPLAFCQAQRFKRQPADGGAVQRAAVVSGCGQHALHLVVLALLKHDFQLVLAALHAGHGRKRRRFVVQLHACQQLLHQLGRDRVGGRGLVNLGHVALGRGLRVDKRAVVGHQQHAGGVVVKPPYRLHLAPGELFGQQGQHARVVAGLARAFKVGRLVQRNVNVLAVLPFLAKDLQHQAIGLDGSLVAGLHFAIDGNIAVFNQRAAVFSRAEALRLEDAVEG